MTWMPARATASRSASVSANSACFTSLRSTCASVFRLSGPVAHRKCPGSPPGNGNGQSPRATPQPPRPGRSCCRLSSAYPSGRGAANAGRHIQGCGEAQEVVDRCFPGAMLKPGDGHPVQWVPDPLKRLGQVLLRQLAVLPLPRHALREHLAGCGRLFHRHVQPWEDSGTDSHHKICSAVSQGSQPRCQQRAAGTLSTGCSMR